MDAELIERLEKAVEALTGATNDFATSMKGLSDESKDLARLFGESSGEMQNWAASTEAAAQGAANFLGIIQDEDSTMIGFAKNLFDAATGADNAKFSIDEMTSSLKKAITVKKVAISALTKMAQASKALTMEMDRQMTQFNRTTSAARMFGREIDFLEGNLRLNMISGEDLTKTYGGLIDNFGQLNRTSEAQRKTLATNTVILQELGVDANNTAKNYNILISALGMTTEEASRQQRQMFTLAQSIGMPADEMAAGFSRASPKLSAFGSKSVDVYKKIAVNAKAAGMQVEDLMSITEQFDRFDTAAESVGKLNAYLGGPFLSVTKMIATTDPTDRMRLLSQATRDAGLSFEQMGYYQRQAIASAMGLQDVNQLALVMNNRFDLLVPKANQSAASIESLAMQTAEFNDVMDVLKQTLMMFVISLRPLIDGIKRLVGGVNSLISSFGSLRVAIAGLMVAMLVLGAATGVITGGFTAFLAVVTVVIGAYILIWTYIGRMRDVFHDLENGNIGTFFLKMGLYIMMIANPIGAFVAVLVNLGDILSFVGDVFRKIAGPALGEFNKKMDKIGKKLNPVIKSLSKSLYDFHMILVPVFKLLLAPLAVPFLYVIRKVNEALDIFIDFLEFADPFLKLMTWSFKEVGKAAKSFSKSLEFKNLAGASVIFKKITMAVVSLIHAIKNPQVSLVKTFAYLLETFPKLRSPMDAVASAFQKIARAIEKITGYDISDAVDKLKTVGGIALQAGLATNPKAAVAVKAVSAVGGAVSSRIGQANSEKAADNASKDTQLTAALKENTKALQESQGTKVEVIAKTDPNKIVNLTTKQTNRLGNGDIGYRTIPGNTA